jgi:hypothetical protein
VIDFVNLKTRPTQFFGDVYMIRVDVRMCIKMSAHIYINIYVYTVFIKKISLCCLKSRSWSVQAESQEKVFLVWVGSTCYPERTG